MTRDWHIIEMTEKQLGERIAEAVEAEREACASVADAFAETGAEPGYTLPNQGPISRMKEEAGAKRAAREIAAAIRAQGTP